MRRTGRLVAATVFALVVCVGRASAVDVRGAWRPETYHLKDGTTHPVTGLIVFTEKDWLVLFFVTEDGEPRRASAEGGTYRLEGDELTFTHLYHFSTGAAMPGLAEAPLRMEVRDAAGGVDEPTRVERDGDRLTLHFGPSGNRMTFRRSSAP